MSPRSAPVLGVAMLLLLEEAGTRVRAPHLADVWERQHEAEREDGNQVTARCHKSPDEVPKLLAVRDESEQNER